MNRNISNQLGQTLRGAREAAGLTLRQVAQAAEMATSTVSRLETGLIDSPRPDHLTRLSRVLGVEIEDLYALAGYLLPEGLPELRPYLRTKYGLPDRAVAQLEEYFQALRSSWDHEREVRHAPGDQES